VFQSFYSRAKIEIQGKKRDIGKEEGREIFLNQIDLIL
jgi:hypothetical protein